MKKFFHTLKKKIHRPELVLLEDGLSWALGQEVGDLAMILDAASVKYRRAQNGYVGYPGDALYYADHFYALNRRAENRGRKIALAYYHGRPGNPGEEFTEVYERLKQRREEIDRIRVTHGEMKHWMVEAGMPEERVFQIPIGIRTSRFPLRQKEDRRESRERLGIPQEAFVIGSFQKDGNGWDKGSSPKLIKGPDVLLQVLEVLKDKIPNLFVSLSGPARGYMLEGLTRLNIPHSHRMVEHEEELVDGYHALDAYLITSRQEGGPKSLLESMSTGVPIISTRVGQCAELLIHDKNGWLTDVEDVDGLVDAVLKLQALDSAEYNLMIQAARQTAEANDHLKQVGLWKEFFTGFSPKMR